MKSKVDFHGWVTLTVTDKDGNIKHKATDHNIVTNDGDQLIADNMAKTPAHTKIIDSTGYMVVGTGSGTAKSAIWVYTPVGGTPYHALETNYPMLKDTGANDNVLQYRTIFHAGDITGSPAIIEVALTNATSSGAGQCLAYSAVTSATVTPTDSLQIDWEITFLGA